jgi:DNA-binding Lrp family transcriptional regulator
MDNDALHDPIDAQILRVLVDQARSTHQAIGEAIGRSPTAVARRQRVMEERGVIAGYRTTLDLARLGFGVTVHITITLASQRREALDAFEAAIAQSPSVVRCDLMSGSDDYLVTVLVRSLDHFAQVHREELSQLPSVARMETSFVLRAVIPPRLPLHWSDAPRPA